MANANSTPMRAQSKPEKIAQWLFKQTSNWRNVCAFLLIVALTAISITFNVSLGLLSSVDETSKTLLPIGYALLDVSALLLAAYAGFKCWDWLRKTIAMAWFFVLLCLSLWAAASFTLSIDARSSSADLDHAIEQKQFEVNNLNVLENIWLDNVANADRFKTKHQNTLADVQSNRMSAADELHSLESSKPRPTMAIYDLVAPWLGLTAEALNTIVRLLWASALTLSPFVLTSVIFAEQRNESDDHSGPTPAKKRRFKGAWSSLKSIASVATVKPVMTTIRALQALSSQISFKTRDTLQRRKLRRLLRALKLNEHQQKNAEMMEASATQTDFVDAHESKQGNNQHTEVLDLRAFEAANTWLLQQSEGRVTRATIGKVCGLYHRESVSNIINALIESGALERLSNGQLVKPRHHLRLIK